MTLLVDAPQIPFVQTPGTLPGRLAGLAQLAQNLAWSWNRDARSLFKSIDESLWNRTRHNPIRLLQLVQPGRLDELATDPVFCARYDRAMQWLAAERSDEHTWYARTFPELRGRPVAYFCAEFGIHNSVPIYSGGLGVLAGDHLKTASDLGVPLVAVGILYRNGYFDQRIRVDGWQEDSDARIEFDGVPLVPLPGRDGARHLVTVNTFGRDIHIRVWKMQVGRVPVYLLDSDLEVNHPEDRPLLSKLYSGGPAMRLRQEWLLGVGGVRALRALGIDPAAWHANEGHAAFMMVERVRELCAGGTAYREAVKQVRNASVFTTHTPVPAGHDHFSVDEVRQCANEYWTEMGIDAETFLRIGFHPESGSGVYHMTAASVRLSRRVNAVSRRHGIVTREMSRSLWPNRDTESIPVGHVTNGVHLATWMATPIMKMLDEHLGPAWGHSNDPALWEQVLTLDDETLWYTHSRLKNTLMRMVREEARRAFAARQMETTQLVGAGTLLDPNTLTIGFARRFATYKRANLIFRDVERLRRLVTNTQRPVQIVFAGKAHPADTPGKQVLQNVYQFTRDPQFEGRVAFVEDYGMHLAHLLVQGVDLWMNLPRVPLEASGTSGMKAALNGVPQLSTVDGWWEEGFEGNNGWAIEPDVDDDSGMNTANRLYELLEQDVVPRFYDRDKNELPRRWLTMMKHAIRVGGQQFTARRMVEQYARAYYAPAILGDSLPDDPPLA
ncbi:MAG: alpha-glucan family phosphorylase [Gemmatimonas sp.]|jgi:starch phosphorylase|uniref:alpha-glucan family phosphorylase n=2 Tax=Gemmatimonas sp. TaxID=1962908 RepID=UPI0022C920FC|nr:alpha-glucan family phosphorylase [Gemmatimonas sp.]MCA2986289.1 alpha-glucan family phosphorylase [Gemmatimonas sp.]MCA2995972.1 alpha-glucan family phosphorylase [Gemmatimonas sp.]MCE2953445.1 alpha-glucan family phosphorylase [Gemmatimonas sp.]MCZ8010476.1 alpha-glucan family phosphorylase [Gemmatimonas sp.]MCZ8267039.1 alpha-glucan family phosphorylase [Gemmatimonas sp.]